VNVPRLDHSFPRPHQKRGETLLPWLLPMRSVPFPNGSPSARLSRALPRTGTFLVLLAIVALLSVGSARAAWSGSPSSPYAWSNGSVLCVFNDSLPSVTVSASSLTGTGMGVGLDQLSELAPSNAAVASAVMSSVVWDPSNESSAQWFVMNYSQTVPVMSVAAPSHSVGSVQIALNLALARGSADASHADQVSFQLSILNWPWQSPQDTLALEVPIWSAVSTSEHIVVGSPSSTRVESVSNASGQPMEYFQASDSANGTSGAMAVSAHTVVVAGKGSTTLSFGSGAGGSKAIAYQATLGITPGTRVLGLPLYDYIAVAGGAGLLALVVGVGTRRVRRRPSDLTYVEESK